jgi:hypothetical protein
MRPNEPVQKGDCRCGAKISWVRVVNDEGRKAWAMTTEKISAKQRDDDGYPTIEYAKIHRCDGAAPVAAEG